MRNIEKKMQRELKRLTAAPSLKIHKKLVSELGELKNLLNLGHELEVEWRPGYVKYSSGRRLSGECLRNAICIYEEDMVSALATLRHEVIEKWVSDELIAPYKHLINALISAFEDDAYRRRERAVKKLCDILDLERDSRDTNR